MTANLNSDKDVKMKLTDNQRIDLNQKIEDLILILDKTHLGAQLGTDYFKKELIPEIQRLNLNDSAAIITKTILALQSLVIRLDNYEAYTGTLNIILKELAILRREYENPGTESLEEPKKQCEEESNEAPRNKASARLFFNKKKQVDPPENNENFGCALSL